MYSSGVVVPKSGFKRFHLDKLAMQRLPQSRTETYRQRRRRGRREILQQDGALHKGDSTHLTPRSRKRLDIMFEMDWGRGQGSEKKHTSTPQSADSETCSSSSSSSSSSDSSSDSGSSTCSSGSGSDNSSSSDDSSDEGTDDVIVQNSSKNALKKDKARALSQVRVNTGVMGLARKTSVLLNLSSTARMSQINGKSAAAAVAAAAVLNSSSKAGAKNKDSSSSSSKHKKRKRKKRKRKSHNFQFDSNEVSLKILKRYQLCAHPVVVHMLD
jgi:hypothetical protein